MIQHKQTKMAKQRESEHCVSFKTIKTVAQYNVGDYLPSQENSQCRSIIHMHRIRDKATTEPVQRLAENEELHRKIVALQQQKFVLKVELERSKRELAACQQNLKQKQMQLVVTQKRDEQTAYKLKELENKRQPHVRLERNTMHFQMFPKFKQSYQVSVQTDPTIQQHSLSKEIKNTSAPPSTDMQHIYQKMQNLKMGRRTSKPDVITMQPTFTTNLKAERPRAFTSNWSTFTKDKQNIMRNSNVIEKKTAQKMDKVRSQNLDLFLMPLEQGQKLLASYIEDSYF